MATSIPAPSVTSHRTAKWLRAAFIIQSVLFAALIAALIFVSVSYSIRQRKTLAEITRQRADLTSLRGAIEQQTHDLATSEMNFALEMKNAKRYPDAALHIDNALRVWPGEPIAWRQKALIFLDSNRGQEALNDFNNPAAAMDRNDPRNMVTEAILYCGLKQPARADQLVAGLPASFSPTPDDKADFKAACGHELGR